MTEMSPNNFWPLKINYHQVVIFSRPNEIIAGIWKFYVHLCDENILPINEVSEDILPMIITLL